MPLPDLFLATKIRLTACVCAFHLKEWVFLSGSLYPLVKRMVGLWTLFMHMKLSHFEDVRKVLLYGIRNKILIFLVYSSTLKFSILIFFFFPKRLMQTCWINSSVHHIYVTLFLGQIPDFLDFICLISPQERLILC